MEKASTSLLFVCIVVLLDVVKPGNLISDDAPMLLRRKRAAQCIDMQHCNAWFKMGYKCDRIKTSCRKTCGLCTDCRDIHPNCRSFSKTYCNSIKYKLWMTKNCAAYCGDQNANCAYWAGIGECQKNPQYMSYHCKTSCGKCGNVKPTRKPIPKKTTPKPAPKKTTPKPKPSRQIPCGTRSLISRIVGGKNAQPGMWPWHVGITDCRNCPTTLPFCGGTLIDNEWVVTAAHCLERWLAYDLYVILGDTSRTRQSGREVTVGVNLIIRHEKYHVGVSYNNDIALLRLSNKVKYTNYIRPACLPMPNTKMSVGTVCTVTGFGKTEEGGSKTPYLQQVSVPLVSTEDCKKVLGDSKISDNMICAGNSKVGKDACQGDSGGPMVCQTTKGSWQLTGVVSWGKGCARLGHYGVYADVQVLRGWVMEKIKQHGGTWNG